MRSIVLALLSAACAPKPVPASSSAAPAVASPASPIDGPAAPPSAPALPPPPPAKITAPPSTWTAFSPPDHAFTAMFGDAPAVQYDRDHNPVYIVQTNFSLFSVSVLDLTASQSASWTTARLVDASANWLRDSGKYTEVRAESSENASWEVRDLWFRLNALGDGVPWYGRKRIAVTTAAPYRVVAALSFVGLPGEEKLADAFVESCVATARAAP